ncbi:hypothetical protein BC940DRAFT_301853 [Gongronella butleri]|nr:hypothetical protein BC940DRAFT_301853 [Gongronella butleri]
MTTLNDFPNELLPLILQWLPTSDLLQHARLASRRWHHSATDIAFERIQFDLSNLDRVREMTACFGTCPDAYFPAKYAEMKMDGWTASLPVVPWASAIDNGMAMAAALLPKLQEVRSLHVDLPNDLALDKHQMNTIRKLVQLPALQALKLSSVAPSYALRPIDLHPWLKHLDYGTQVLEVDLQYVLTLLQRLPHLQSLTIRIASLKISGQPFREFTYRSLAHLPQHHCLKTLSFGLESEDSTEPPELMCLTYFFAHLTPHISAMQLRMDLLSTSTEFAHILPLDFNRLPPLPRNASRAMNDAFTAALSTENTTNTSNDEAFFYGTRLKHVPLELDLVLKTPALYGALDHFSRSLVHGLSVQQHDADPLDIPLIVNGMKALTHLELDGCEFDHPGVLERALRKLPNLKTISLFGSTCRTWQFQPRGTPMTEWEEKFRTFFERYQGEQGSSLRWLSLPNVTRINVKEQVGDFLGARVHVVLVDPKKQKRGSAPVRIWLRDVPKDGRLESHVSYRLCDDDVRDVLLVASMGLRYAQPAHMLSSNVSDKAAAVIHILCTKKSATFYAAPAAKRWRLLPFFG